MSQRCAKHNWACKNETTPSLPGGTQQGCNLNWIRGYWSSCSWPPTQSQQKQLYWNSTWLWVIEIEKHWHLFETMHVIHIYVAALCWNKKINSHINPHPVLLAAVQQVYFFFFVLVDNVFRQRNRWKQLSVLVGLRVWWITGRFHGTNDGTDNPCSRRTKTRHGPKHSGSVRRPLSGNNYSLPWICAGQPK